MSLKLSSVNETSSSSLRLWNAQLHKILEPYFLSGIESIYIEAVKLAPKNSLQQFQELLQSIPNWTNGIIDAEVRRIKHETELNDLVDKLFNVIMLETIIIMTATPLKKKNIIKLPKDITFGGFIHKVYIKIAEQLFENPFIIEGTSNKGSENTKKIITIINKSMDDTLTNLIPLKYILENYSSGEDSTAKEPVYKSEEKIHITGNASLIQKISDNIIGNKKVINPDTSHSKKIQIKADGKNKNINVDGKNKIINIEDIDPGNDEEVLKQDKNKE